MSVSCSGPTRVRAGGAFGSWRDGPRGIASRSGRVGPFVPCRSRKKNISRKTKRKERNARPLFAPRRRASRRGPPRAVSGSSAKSSPVFAHLRRRRAGGDSSRPPSSQKNTLFLSGASHIASRVSFGAERRLLISSSRPRERRFGKRRPSRRGRRFGSRRRRD